MLVINKEPTVGSYRAISKGPLLIVVLIKILTEIIVDLNFTKLENAESKRFNIESVSV